MRNLFGVSVWVALGALPIVVGCGDANQPTSSEILVSTSSALSGFGRCGTFTDDEACVCTDSNFGGSCAIVNAFRHFYQSDVQIGLPNDSISSLVVGANVNLRYCADSEFRGTCATIAGTAGGASRTLLTGNPGNDSISSLRVDRKSDNCQSPGANQVSVFVDGSFNGDCAVLTLIPGLQHADFPGNVANSNSQGYGGPFGIPNDSLSSLKVGANVHAIVYADKLGDDQIQALFEPGTYTASAMGSNINDTASAMSLRLNNATRVAFKTLSQDELPWSEIQGLAHNQDYWFVVRRDRIQRIPINSSLASTVVGASVFISDFPELVNNGCNHFGDADLDPTTGILLVPMEGCRDPTTGVEQPFVVALRPNTGPGSVLTYVCADELYLQGPVDTRPGRAPFLALHPITRLLYSTQDRVASAVPAPGLSFPLYVYSVNYNNIGSGACNLTACLQGVQVGDLSRCVLTDAPKGSQDVSPPGLLGPTPTDSNGFIIPQGGVFSSDGKLFYLTNGSGETPSADCATGAFGGGLNVFDATGSGTWPLIARTGNEYGLFRYQWLCEIPHSEEPEGLDYFDMDLHMGAFRGKLHALVYSNGNFKLGLTPNAWVKHYDTN